MAQLPTDRRKSNAVSSAKQPISTQTSARMTKRIRLKDLSPAMQAALRAADEQERSSATAPGSAGRRHAANPRWWPHSSGKSPTAASRSRRRSWRLRRLDGGASTSPGRRSWWRQKLTAGSGLVVGTRVGWVHRGLREAEYGDLHGVASSPDPWAARQKQGWNRGSEKLLAFANPQTILWEAFGVEPGRLTNFASPVPPSTDSRKR